MLLWIIVVEICLLAETVQAVQYRSRLDIEYIYELHTCDLKHKKKVYRMVSLTEWSGYR